MFEVWLNAVVDYGERKDIATEVYRDDEGIWCVRLKFRDSKGWYFAMVSYVDGDKGKSKETVRDFRERIRKSLIDLCADTHKARNDSIRREVETGKLPQHLASMAL